MTIERFKRESFKLCFLHFVTQHTSGYFNVSMCDIYNHGSFFRAVGSSKHREKDDGGLIILMENSSIKSSTGQKKEALK